MSRILLDTNILVRVVSSPEGPAADLFDQLSSSNYVLVTSAALLAELLRTLGYERIRALHGLDDSELTEFVDRIAAGSSVVATEEPPTRVVPDDPDDDLVVAAAVAGNAKVICTRNKHLRHPDVVAYCAARSIRIMDDLELLQEMRSRPP